MSRLGNAESPGPTLDDIRGAAGGTPESTTARGGRLGVGRVTPEQIRATLGSPVSNTASRPPDWTPDWTPRPFSGPAFQEDSAQDNSPASRGRERWTLPNLSENRFIKMVQASGGLAKGALEAYRNNDAFRAKIQTTLTIALIRAGINWGTGGLSWVASGALGAGAGATRAFIAETNKAFAQEKQKVAGRIEETRRTTGGSAADEDLEQIHRLESTANWDLMKKFRAVENKKVLLREVGEGAVAGLLGGIIGVSLEAYLPSHSEISLIGNIGRGSLTGGTMGTINRLSTFKPREIFSKKTGYQVITGAVFGGAFAGLAGVTRDIIAYAGSPGIEQQPISNLPEELQPALKTIDPKIAADLRDYVEVNPKQIQKVLPSFLSQPPMTGILRSWMVINPFLLIMPILKKSAHNYQA